MKGFGMNNANLVGVDLRIIEEEYRNYDLLARYWDGQYRGYITKGNSVIANYDGADINTIIQNLRSIVDRMLELKFTSKLTSVPNSSDYSDAFRHIAHVLSLSEKKMLTTHSKAKDGRLSLNQLRIAGGFNSTVETFLCYVAIASRLKDELGYVPTIRCSSMDPALSVLLKERGYIEPTIPAEGELLTLRDEVKNAICERHWVQ